MSRTYMKKSCWYCQKEICNTGLAQASHMRSHVKKGQLIERVHRFNGDMFSTYHRPKPLVEKEA